VDPELAIHRDAGEGGAVVGMRREWGERGLLGDEEVCGTTAGGAMEADIGDLVQPEACGGVE